MVAAAGRLAAVAGNQVAVVSDWVAGSLAAVAGHLVALVSDRVAGNVVAVAGNDGGEPRGIGSDSRTAASGDRAATAAVVEGNGWTRCTRHP